MGKSSESNCKRCGAALITEPGKPLFICRNCGQQHAADTFEASTPPYEEQVVMEIQNKKWRQAIGIVRQNSNLDLKQARDYVNGLASRFKIDLPKSGCAGMVILLLGSSVLLTFLLGVLIF